MEATMLFGVEGFRRAYGSGLKKSGLMILRFRVGGL